MKEAVGEALVLGFPEYGDQARGLAEAAGFGYAQAEIHRFPDHESLVTLPAGLPPRVVFCRSLDRPNDKLVELALAARTARDLGAEHLTLVAPYLCYMRQDKAFRAGEAVSQRIVGRLLADWFDALVTVDPHLHRVGSLEEAVPVRQSSCLSAAPAIAGFLAGLAGEPVLVGPDAESRQWVQAIAQMLGLEYGIGVKERLGDRSVRVRFSGMRCRGRHLILVDDVASTGHTLEAAALALGAERPLSLSAFVTHALFLEGAIDRLRAAGVQQVWSSDSIPHTTNEVRLASLLAGVLNA